MKRVFLIGNSPLPDENVRVRPAAGLRTWQFLKMLREGRFLVEVFLIGMDGGSTEGDGEHKSASEGVVTGETRVPKDDPLLRQKLQAAIDAFEPDAVVAVNTFPSFITSGLNFRAPFWADLNGWIMAEAQAQAFKSDSDDYLGHYWQMERNVLESADKISCVSAAQSHAVLGELAAIGRLGRENFGYDFTEVVPNGTEWFESDKLAEMSDVEREALGDIPEDAFVLLWMGGYNTWVDEVNLFKGVRDAMVADERIWFVSTGGAIEGLDNKTFTKFKALVDDSEFAERFKFLGWVDTTVIPHLYARANAGLNIDRRCTETTMGARNRINEMMKFGLPVITTAGSEIAMESAAHGAGLLVESGNHEALTEAILGMANASGEELREYSERGQMYIKAYCSYSRVMKPLLSWLENPRPAPSGEGRGQGFGRGGGLFAFGDSLLGGIGLRGALRYLRENGIKKSLKKFLQRLRK